MRVINLFAGPGAGKSTTAAGLFHLMKLKGHRVELVTEYAKDLTYERAHMTLSNQLTILGEQFNRMHRLVGQVDWLVTDSPLLLGLMYSSGPFRQAWFTSACYGAYQVFDNRNILLQREKAYVTDGRNQTEDEAREIDKRVEGLLAGLGLEYTKVAGSEAAHQIIYQEIVHGAAEAA